MKENFYELSPVIEGIILKEKPRSVLEISGYNEKYGRLISDCQKRAHTGTAHIGDLKVDRISLIDKEFYETSKVYTKVYLSDVLGSLSDIEKYDIIVIFHLLENMYNEDAKVLLEALLEKTKNQILVITPQYPYDLSADSLISDVQTYYPEFFHDINFNHKMLNSSEGVWQGYCFFPDPIE